jgi:hypothetical protein
VRQGHRGAAIRELREGPVDPEGDHFELRFGLATQGNWDEWILVALVGPPEAGATNIQFLVASQESTAFLIEKVWREVKFYLLELNEKDPWVYAQHHCGTSSNLYSDIHWSFRKSEDDVPARD